MYCNHCGAELPDGSKFCQDCGTVTKAAAAEQKAKKKVETPPPAPTPSPSDTKKSSKKKVNPLLIAIIIVVIAAVGSLVGKFAIAPSLSDGEGDTNTTANILGTNEAPEPGINYDSSNEVTYRDPGSLDYNIFYQQSKTYTYQYDNNNTTTINIKYSTKNNYVNDISIHINLDENFPQYYQYKGEFVTYETLFENLNDPKASTYNYTEYSNGAVSFYGYINGLCASDRAGRLSLASTVLGIPYDTANNSYNFTDLDSALIANGFVEQ